MAVYYRVLMSADGRQIAAVAWRRLVGGRTEIETVLRDDWPYAVVDLGDPPTHPDADLEMTARRDVERKLLEVVQETRRGRSPRATRYQ